MRYKKPNLHPATLFAILTAGIVLLSWIASLYGFMAYDYQTDTALYARSLLSAEGLRWWVKHGVERFTSFPPLGVSLIALFAMSVTRHSGLADTCMSWIGSLRPKMVLWLVIVLGIISNVFGDGGYIFIPPLAALLFKQAGLRPVDGIIIAFASVACGYGANLCISTLDYNLAHLTNLVLSRNLGDLVSPMGGHFLTVTMAVVIAPVFYAIAKRVVMTGLSVNGNTSFEPLTIKERKAGIAALFTALVCVVVVTGLTFFPLGVLRGADGGLTHSPFAEGLLLLLSISLAITAVVYGRASGRFRMSKDIIHAFTHSLNPIGEYLVICFFASQCAACLEFSCLGQILLMHGVEWLSLSTLPTVLILVVLILFTAVSNLLVVSATTKWVVLSALVIPLSIEYGIAPQITQCAFRVGDSATNALTPLLSYVPLTLFYLHGHMANVTYKDLYKRLWPFSIATLLVWSLLFLLWVCVGIPVGL